jgi:hypothetical protein
VLVEQGTTFTVVETRHFFELTESERDDPAASLISARRMWLPAAPGSDWLHDGAAGVVAPTGVGFAIDTRRQSAEVGAGGGFLEVVLVLYLVAEHSEVGRRLQGDLYEWVKRRVTERRKETGFEDADPAPDFSTYDRDQLTRQLKSELADVAKVPEARLELVRERQGGAQSVLYAVIYRDVKTKREYLVEVGGDEVTFSLIED